MDVLELIDETFDKDRTEVYELSIQVSLNGFSFAIKDTIRSTYICLVSKSFKNQLYSFDHCNGLVDEIISGYPFVAQKFKRVIFAYSNSLFAIVPKNLFEIDRLKDIYELSQPLPEHFELHHTGKTNGSDYTIIFSMPYTLSSAWLKIQPNTTFTSPIISLLYSSDISKNSKLLQVCFADQQLHIMFHEEEKLIAANSFECKNANDATYFILSFCNSLGVDPSLIHIHFYGHSLLSEEIVRIVSNYASNISSDAHYSSIHFSYQLLRHRVKYFTLFNSTEICE